MGLDALSLPDLVDQYHLKRTERLAAKKKYDDMEAEEKEIKARIIALLISSKQVFASGKLKMANLNRKEKPSVTDWPKVYAFIKENDAFDLLHKRLTESAVEERWEDGVQVPGVQKFPVYDISLSNV